MHIKQFLVYIFASIPFIVHGGFTKEENPATCLGTIILHNGEEIDVNDIQIGLHSTFEVYSVPQIKGKTATPTAAGINELFLANDPRDVKSTFNLMKINTIEVPDPSTVYIYKATESSLAYNYIEVLVNGDRYLAPKETKIEAVEKSKGSQRVIKLSGLKKFAIKACVLTLPEDKKGAPIQKS